jgi:2'-5' RNA ligase
MQNQNLKLIAILLPDTISQQVKKEQLFIAKTWGPKHALRTPPHITIIPPLSTTDAEEISLLKIGEKICATSQAFILDLDKYDAFQPRVVFIHTKDSPGLNALQATWRKELLSTLPHALDRYPERPYHPHITLAHRDVKPEQFKKIWAHYAEQEYATSFEVNRYWMLRHEKSGWIPEKEFHFAKLIS